MFFGSLSCVLPITVNLVPFEFRLNAVTKTRFSDASYYYWRSATEAYAAAEDPRSRYNAECSYGNRDSSSMAFQYGGRARLYQLENQSHVSSQTLHPPLLLPFFGSLVCAAKSKGYDPRQQGIFNVYRVWARNDQDGPYSHIPPCNIVRGVARHHAAFVGSSSPSNSSQQSCDIICLNREVLATL